MGKIKLGDYKNAKINKVLNQIDRDFPKAARRVLTCTTPLNTGITRSRFTSLRILVTAKAATSNSSSCSSGASVRGT